MAEDVHHQALPTESPSTAPVVFFNSSTRLTGLSLNAAFALLTSWALRLQGVPVIHFVCQSGLEQCVLGALGNNGASSNPGMPPCQTCIAQSRVLFHQSRVFPFKPQERKPNLPGLMEAELDGLYEYAHQGIPLGKLVLPAIRWVLRRHHLEGDEATLSLYRKYIQSAYHLAQEFTRLLDQARPQIVVLFNGQFYPEATARWVALQRGVRVVTHEVGLQPLSAFFTDGEATAYPLHIPDGFDLSPAQNARLDAYLSKRFQGEFSMAGIQFWPEMQALSTEFLEKASHFEGIVPVFTNVVFDTSQPHSNVVFPHMFAWLDLVLQVIRSHPKTLFVLRAHPDENRPGKASRESVRQWVERYQVRSLTNVLFYDSGDYVSSYQLIQHARFSLIYNSTIGLEASIMGTAVLCAGKARFTQIPTVFFPRTPGEFQELFEKFLAAEKIQVPTEFQRNARRFLYYQLFKSSLPFERFIEPDGIWQGFVRLRNFNVKQLMPKSSPTMQILMDGLLASAGDALVKGTQVPFLLPEAFESMFDEQHLHP
jgi:hypothetical protein